jgi:DNA-directed RNA polymerase subunit K/omega
MTDAQELTDQAADAPLEPAPPITDRFLFVDVAAMRAKQLRRGARPRLGPHTDTLRDAPIKPERIAMEEVRRGLVQYAVPEHKPRHTEPRP